MDSNERVVCALQRARPDRVPWIEIYVDKSVAAKILGEELVVDYGYIGVSCDEHGLPVKKNDAKWKKELPKWVELAGRINLDALGMHFWPPVFTSMTNNSLGRMVESEGLVGSMDAFEKLIAQAPDPDDESRYALVGYFVDFMKKNKLASFLAASFALDVAVRGMGFEKFCFALYDNLHFVERVLDWYVDYAIRTIRQLLKFQPDFIWITDDIAYKSGPFISPSVFRDVVMPKYARLAREIKCPWIYHSDGNILPVIDDLISLGMNALHPMEATAVDIVQVKRTYGNRVCVAGNVDIDILARGTQKNVKDEVFRLVNEMGNGPGYILSSGNAIVDYVKPENLVAMGEAVGKCSRRTAEH